MRIKALRNTAASGQSLEAGKVYEVSEEDARVLIRMGKACPVGTLAAPEPVQSAEASPPEKAKPAKKGAK